MNDISYFIFLSTCIKDVYISKNDILPYSVGYISKSEIDKYIKDNGVIMTNNLDFKLYSEQTWNV